MFTFFIQLVVILAACRAFGAVLRRFGQPQVVSEMVAGLLLGPSLLGWLFPVAHSWIFPEASRSLLFVVSRAGLLVYMYLVGLEFDAAALRPRLRGAAAVSAAGIAAPFVLGGVLGFLLSGDTMLFPAWVGPWRAGLFLGCAMSITAFPVLARILEEKGLMHTSAGRIALAAGSIDDAAAWCVLGAGLFGLFPVFGAFLLGALTPRGRSIRAIERAVSPAIRLVFLPLFFACSGLNTRIALLSTPWLWGVAAAVIAAAALGKVGACWAAARLSGEPQSEALAIGALMNARGLMELIILNIGLERGIIQPALFTVLVLMAVVTTLAATPLLDRVTRSARRKSLAPSDAVLA